MANKNTVDIYFDGHENGLRTAIQKVKADLQSLRNERISVKVDTDTGELSRLRRELDALRDRTVTVDVELRNAGALAELAAFDAARGNATVSLDLDTGAAAAELAAFIAAVPRSVTINLDVDTAGAAAELAAFRLALLALNNDTINLGSSASSAARGVGALGAAGGGLLKSAPGIAALSVALAPLISGAAGASVYAVAAGLGAVTAAAGALSVGFGGALAAIPIASAATSQKVVDHFTFMKNDVIETMKEISAPVQEPLVNLATAVGAAFHQIRPSLDVVTAGAARLVNELSGKMPAIAAQIGPAMEQAFGAAEPHIKNLISNIPSYIQAIGNFAGKLGDPAIVQGAQRVFGMIPGIIDGAGDSLVSMANGFQNVMSYLDSGALDGFTTGVGALFDELGSTDWSGTIDGISNMANSFGELAGSIDGDSISGAIEGITSDITKFTNAAKDVGTAASAFGDFLQGVGDSAVNFGEVSGLNSFGDQINAALDKIGLINWKGPKVQANPDLTSVTPMMDQVLAALGQGPPVPLPPVEQPVIPVFDDLGLAPAIPPVEVPLEPGPMPPPPPPIEPVKIETQAELTNLAQPEIPPLKVPVEYDTTGIGTLTIDAPEPIKVPVEILPPPPPDMSAFNVDLTAQGAAAGATFAAGLAGSAGVVAGAAASMAAAAQNVSVDLSGQGAAAGASFAAGIRSQAGAVAAAAAELGRIAAANKGHYKGRKGIAADRIMLIPHGQAMVKGFIGGMQSQKSDLINAAQGLARDVYTAFDDDLVPNIGLSGGMDIRQKVVVQVEAGLMADPIKIGREVKDVLNAYGKEVGSSSQVINV
ncbi:hypothetical protein [Rhodococcoides fascians]|uniref:hypothetical protein n=1 Tax=Rhodococcoides fascians TaxID=1828 RepID=UPI00055FB836|nr:hypothetical protein [Rhodococcus fascians]